MKMVVSLTIIVLFYFLIKDGIECALSKPDKRTRRFIDCIIDAVLIFILIIYYHKY